MKSQKNLKDEIDEKMRKWKEEVVGYQNKKRKIWK